MKRVPKYLDLPPEPLLLDGFGFVEPPRHVFESKDVEAINAALAAGRPLLLRGEPGSGKSQLARAAAKGLGRAFVSTVVDARTESGDLLFTFDAVRRLADAQVFGAERLQRREQGKADPLAEQQYIAPGPLWWAFQWDQAEEQAQEAQVSAPRIPEDCSAQHGVVVLIDEIDKADSSVPNGLLGALGDGCFALPGGGVVERGRVEPLVVITTNEERSLPDAFLRRCLVHHLGLPEDGQALFEHLVARGQAHFPQLNSKVLAKAAELLMVDRQQLRQRGMAAPGCAEYLDLLRIVYHRGKDQAHQKELLKVVSRFVLEKHPKEPHG